MNGESIRSFRDPSGFCFSRDARVLRYVAPGQWEPLEEFLRSRCAESWFRGRKLVGTRALSSSDCQVLGLARTDADSGRVYEHERIWFPSYPCEWPAEMLFAAGELTVDLALGGLEEGFGLKDATPYNVLFEGARPVFVDVPSFERREAGDVVWRPYAQFVRTFLLPLLAHRRWGVRLADVFVGRRDGLEPEEVFRWCGPFRRWFPPYLGWVTLPTYLARRGERESTYRPRLISDEAKARFVVESTLKRVRRGLHRLRPCATGGSNWSAYMETHSYSEPAFAAKEAFVRQALDEFRPKRLLDVGANTGHFSGMAARAGARVVAVDTDPACAGAIWQRAQRENLDVQALVVDFARPTPALGWRNRENLSFLERATGAFDGLLMLAILHHLLVTERVPLESVIELAAGLAGRFVVIEFVAPADPMFHRLTRGREHLHAGLDRAAFEQACRQHFEVVRSQPLAGTHRILYLLRKP